MYSGFNSGGYDDRWECLCCTLLNNKDFLCCEVCLSVRRSNDDDNLVAMNTKSSVRNASAMTSNDDAINVSDNCNQSKRRKINVNIIPCPRPFPEFMMINEYPLENRSSIKIITNILTSAQLASFNSFYNRCLLIDEAKGNDHKKYNEACNQGVLGYWKPNLYSHASELQSFRTDGHPYLITNTSTMVNGGENSIEENGVGYKIIRSHKPTGFFLTDDAKEQNKVYIKPKYAGQTCVESQNIQPELLDILKTVSKISKQYFNGILINVYPDGNVNINAHSDSEGRRSSIATLSFGAEREFVIREKNGNFKQTIVTKPNQLIIMQGSQFQNNYTHEITKDPNCKEQRISLTFRNHEIKEE